MGIKNLFSFLNEKNVMEDLINICYTFYIYLL